MKKNLFAILLAICVMSVAGTAHAVSFQLEQGYQYFFKYTNFEYIPDGTGFTSGDSSGFVPNEIKGFYRVSTIDRAPAEIIGGVLMVDLFSIDFNWWNAGDNGEFLDGEFMLSLNSVAANGDADWDAVLDMWLDTNDVDTTSVATAKLTFGDGDGDMLLAALESVTYKTEIAGTADGTEQFVDIKAAASLKFVTNNTGIDWYTNPDGSQFGLTSSIFILDGDPFDFFSQDPLTGTSPVPEPASLVLLGAGLVGFLKKRKSL